MIKKYPYLFASLCFSCLLSITSIQASDHVDGEISIQNPVADITDVFAFINPNDPDRLTLILNSYPFISSKGHFSDRLVYSVLLKEAALSGRGTTAAIKTKGKTYRIDCTFETPHNKNPHTITCLLPSGKTSSTPVNQVFADAHNGVYLFAGKRADPFLFSASWFSALVFNHQIPKATATNDLTRMNILSVILDIDIKQVLQRADKPLLAVAGQIAKRGGKNQPTEIIDRAARPEISNAHLVTASGQEDLRRLYNSEKPFLLNPAHEILYKKRMEENIRYYDALDGVIDWQPAWRATLINLLIHDYLIIDTSKPFSNHSYLSIENSLLRNQSHTRSGGRAPGENIIDKLMTLLINGGHGIAISDGILQSHLPSQTFPYLAEPNKGLLSIISTYFAPSLTAKMALTKRNLKTMK